MLKEGGGASAFLALSATESDALIRSCSACLVRLSLVVGEKGKEKVRSLTLLPLSSPG
jgi:hypothetical protein